MAASGVMPRTASLLKEGLLSPMSVPLPEISSVSWSSFMTGADPGTHGIFGFVDLDPGSYSFRYPDFRDLKCPTLFDELGRLGRRSVVVNLPSTYPAREFPGILISGFIAIHLDKSVFPLEYLPFLKKIGYQVDVDLNKGKDRPSEFMADLQYCLQVKKETVDFLWKQEDWDLLMFVVTETDRLHHFLFDAWKNPQNLFFKDFQQFYHDVDLIIGDLVDRSRRIPDCGIMLLSDHGFFPVEREIYINPILEQNGFYSTSLEKRKSLDGISSSTRAFALDPSRIFIHNRERFPRGRVSPLEHAALTNELQSLCENFKVGGHRVIQKVYRREDIYHGPHLESAADLILLPEPGFDLKAGLEKKDVSGTNHFTGMHRYDNAFFFSTTGQALPEVLSITKIRGLIEDYLLERCRTTIT